MIITNAKAIELKPIYDGTELSFNKHIELCGKTCYKSEDNITEDSAMKFVQMIKDRDHTAMLEHGTHYLKFDLDLRTADPDMNLKNYLYESLSTNPYTKVNVCVPKEDYLVCYATTNERVLNANGGQLRQLIELINKREPIAIKLYQPPHSGHAVRRTFLITCDRGVTHELVRHRVFSFAQESTRYVNYSKGKYGNQITVIKPCFFDENEDGDGPYATWKESCENAERAYLALVEKGCTAQEARSVLPNSTKADIVLTATEGQWQEFFKLRCDKAAHPQMQEVANMVKELFDSN